MADGINLTALAAPTTILPSKNAAGVILTSAGATGTIVESMTGTNLNAGTPGADTYEELVSLSTAGWLLLCGVYTVDATSRTISVKVVLDGVTVFDFTSSAIVSTGNGFFAVGHVVGVGDESVAFGKVRFNSSLSISIKQSLAETAKIALKYLTMGP